MSDKKMLPHNTQSAISARISSSAPWDLVLHHKFSPRVGVNGPMLKLTFISFIHPAKSAAMKRILAHKNVHLKMPCDSHFAESLMTLLLTRGFRIHAWDISSEICWYYQDGEKAAEADIWSFHTINHQPVRELRLLFHPQNNVRLFKTRQEAVGEDAG